MEYLQCVKPHANCHMHIISFNPYNNPDVYPHFTDEHIGTFLISGRPVSPGTFLVWKLITYHGTYFFYFKTVVVENYFLIWSPSCFHENASHSPYFPYGNKRIQILLILLTYLISSKSYFFSTFFFNCHHNVICGEGNGNPLRCSCLENPRDGGAWWAAVCGVAQSRTRLKRLSGSSSSIMSFGLTNLVGCHCS